MAAKKYGVWMLCGGLLAVGCGTSVEPAQRESRGTVQSALNSSDSLVTETSEGVADTIQASVTGLEDYMGGKNQGGLFAVARYNAARNGLGVQLWELKDRETAPGVMFAIGSEIVTPVSNAMRVYAAALGPTTTNADGSSDGTHRFVVATRESGGMKLRSYLATEGCTKSHAVPPKRVSSWCDGTASFPPALQLQKTFSTNEAVVNISITPIFQSTDIATPLQFATATTSSVGQLTVTSWKMDASGTITRGTKFITGDLVSGVAAAAPKSPWGMFTTASILSGSQDLKVTAWKVLEDGTLIQKGSYNEVGDLTQITASSAGFRRTAVAFNDRGGAGAKIANFEIDSSSWNVTRVAEADLGSGSNDPKSVFIAAGGAGRVFLAGDTATPSTTVRSWSVSSNLRQIDDGFAHISDRQVQSATVIKGDRLVVASVTSTGQLELRTWRDLYAPLARNQWTPSNNGSGGAGGTGGAPADSMTETPFFPKNPASGTQDNPKGSPERLIASSPRFVVTCGTGACSFNDKAGNELATTSIASIFSSLMPELQRNCEAQYPCNPESNTISCPLSSSSYDSRVLYSQDAGRFVILTHLRGDQSNGRHLAWAVSKTEDPRGGFWTYANLESIYRDDPKMAAAGGVLMLSYDGLSDSPPDDETSVSWKPAVNIFDLNDLAANAAVIRNTKLPGSQVLTGNTATDAQLGSGNNHMPVHFSQPRVIFNTAPQPPTVVPSDLSFFYQPITKRLFAYWKDVEGPVTVYNIANPLPNVDSKNQSEYEAFYSKEVSDGIFHADFVRVGTYQTPDNGTPPNTGFLVIQDLGLVLQRGVGFTQWFPEQRVVLCDRCERPTPATYDGKILIAYKQFHPAPDNGYDAKYMYLRDIFAIPKDSTDCNPPACTIGLVQQGDHAIAPYPQNYLIAPDGGNSASVFNGFWLTHSYSCGGKDCAVEMRVLPH